MAGDFNRPSLSQRPFSFFYSIIKYQNKNVKLEFYSKTFLNSSIVFCTSEGSSSDSPGTSGCSGSRG